MQCGHHTTLVWVKPPTARSLRNKSLAVDLGIELTPRYSHKTYLNECGESPSNRMNWEVRIEWMWSHLSSTLADGVVSDDNISKLHIYILIVLRIIYCTVTRCNSSCCIGSMHMAAYTVECKAAITQFIRWVTVLAAQLICHVYHLCKSCAPDPLLCITDYPVPVLRNSTHSPIASDGTA